MTRHAAPVRIPSPARGLTATATALVAVVFGVLLAAAPAEAIRRCLGLESCDLLSGEPPSLTFIAQEGEDLTLVAGGDLRLIVRPGGLVADLLELRATDAIHIAPGLGLTAGSLDLCAGSSSCAPTDLGPPIGNPLAVRLPEKGGVLRFGAVGRILVVPEPSTALLLGMGLLGLAARRGGARGHGPA